MILVSATLKRGVEVDDHGGIDHGGIDHGGIEETDPRGGVPR